MGTGMSNLSFYEQDPQQAIVVVDIYIDEKLLEAELLLESVWVRKELNKIGKAEVNFKVWSSSTSEETNSNIDILQPGNKIRIEAGYHKEGETKSIFEGVIIEQKLDLVKVGTSSIKIGCRDYLYLATLAPKTTIFNKINDKSLLQNIAAAYQGLDVKVGDANFEFQSITQHKISDWDFLLERAANNGFVIQMEGKTCVIDSPKVDAKPILVLKLFDNIEELKAEVQAQNQLSIVKVLAWNQKEQKLEVTTCKNDDVNDNDDQGDESFNDLDKALGRPELIIQESTFSDQATIKKKAEAQMLFSSLQKVKGEISCQGTADIIHGSLVTIEDVSLALNGNAFCGAVEHDIKSGKWKTTAVMGFDYKGVKAQEKNPKVSSLQIGKVTKIDEDPQKEYNIQVEIPLFTGDEINKIWARRSTFWASNGYGSFFIPDVGDEVVVGFFDNDESKPVILGSLYSSKQAPSEEQKKENYIKSLVSKAKLSLSFDDEKKVITWNTPGGNSIVISDDAKGIQLTDQNKNSIVMDANGITIKSASTLNLEAKTTISIQAGTELAMNGKSAVNISGANIEAKADVGFTAKGSASAELSAGGQTVVKGAMVMIN